MSDNKAPAIHIAPEHQSAPKQSWADKEVEKAAEEIRDGKFRPDLSGDADLLGMVGTLRGVGIKSPQHQSAVEKIATMTEMADSLALAQHPRVQAALARLEQEKRDARTPQEMLEKAQMLHELNSRAGERNQWDGQGRWIGKDNEKMRTVNIMRPTDWLKRLEAVIGEGRVFINRFAVLGRVAVLVPNDEQNRKLILMPDQLHEITRPKEEMLGVGTLQYPCGPEWMVMRFDAYGVPTQPKYLGWRTVLLSLIVKRIITEKEAHKAFPLMGGPAGDWYREQLFEFRSVTGMLQ